MNVLEGQNFIPEIAPPAHLACFSRFFGLFRRCATLAWFTLRPLLSGRTGTGTDTGTDTRTARPAWTAWTAWTAWPAWTTRTTAGTTYCGGGIKSTRGIRTGELGNLLESRQPRH